MEVKYKDKVRRRVLKNKNIGLSLILNANQKQLCKDIAKLDFGETSGALALKLGISAQNASAKLKLLYLKGYLTRELNSASTGGREYVYQFRHELK